MLRLSRVIAIALPLASAFAAAEPVHAPPPGGSGVSDPTAWWRADRMPKHCALPPTAGSPRRASPPERTSVLWVDGPFSPADSPAPGGVPVEQVVVTSVALSDAFQRFADDETRRGVPTVVRTTSWIDARYAGPDGPARIRSFLRDAHDQWGTRYVVLGGDVEHVPTRYVPWESEEIPADLYYECLDRNWNEDGDAIWGEPITAGLFDGLVNDIACAADGRTWAATYFGVAVDDGASFTVWQTADGLPSDEVLCVHDAADGTVWAGTAGGLARWDGATWRAWTTADGLPDPRITCVDAVSATDAWAGTNLGLVHWDGQSLTTYGTADGLPHAAITSLAREGDVLWIGTLGGVARWEAGTFTSWTAATGLLSNWVYSIDVDSAGRVWAGHADNWFAEGGISRLDGGVWTTESFPTWNGLTVRDFALGPGADDVWAATSRGLLHFDGTSYSLIPEGTGLPGDVYAVESHDATLTVATAQGIARGTPAAWVVRGVADGLPVAAKDYDDIDLISDVVVGRIPATDPGEVETYRAKLAAYRRGEGADHADRLLVLGENLFSPGDGKALGQAAGARFPASYARTELYEVDGTENRATALAALNAGPGWVVQVSHGSYDVLGVGAPSELLFNRDLDLTDSGGRPAFVLIFSCNAGAFDFESSAEHLLFHPTGGAIATIANSREAVPGVDAEVNEALLDSLFASPDGRAAEALQAARAAAWADAPNTLRTASWDRHTYLSHSYLGAPDLPLWRAQPRALVVACPAEVSLSRAPIVVHVTDAATGDPVGGARVCVSKAGEAWGRGTTDAAGDVDIPFRPGSPGAVDVVVTASGYALARQPVQVVAAAGPLVVAESSEVLEVRSAPTSRDLDVRLALRNAGTDAASGWALKLVSQEPAVQVVEGPVDLAAMDAGDTAWVGPFRLRVHPGLPDGAPFFVRLEGTGAVPFTETFRLELRVPELRLATLRVAGELVQPVLENVGGAPSGVLRAEVVPIEGGGIVLHGTTSMPSLAPGEQRELPAELRVTGPASARFRLDVRDGRGTALARDFDREAPAAPSAATHEPLDGGARLEWTPSVAPDVAGYRVLRRDGVDWEDISPGAPIPAALAEVVLPPGASAHFAILSVDGGGVESPDTCFAKAYSAPPTLAGWPRRLPSLVGPSPVIASDLDGDGIREVLLGSMWEANAVSVFHADGREWADGDGRVGTTGPFGVTGGRVHAAPLAWDVDGDGRKEIFAVSFDGKAYAWRVADGATGAPALLPGWPVQLSASGARSGPVPADVDGDGVDEIVTFALDGRVRVLEPNGTMAAGWPKVTAASGSGSTPAVWDFDGDGKEDLVFGGTDSFLYLVSGDGTDFPGWPVRVDSKVLSSPVLADVDGDEVPEIFVMTRDGRVWGFHAEDRDGTPGADPLPGWPVSFEPYEYTPPSPAVADFDGDGIPEIVVPGASSVAIFRADGTPFPGWPKDVGAPPVNSPVVADLDGDGTLDLLIGTYDRKLRALHLDGTSLPGWPRTFHERPWSTPFVADVDGDGDLDVVLAADDLEVRIVDVAGPDTPGATPWPGYHGGESLRGVWRAQVPGPIALRAGAPPVPAVVTLQWAPPAPNPFRTATSLAFTLPVAGRAQLDVYDVAGRRVRTLVRDALPAGRHAVAWDGREDSGRAVSAGVYFLRLVTDGDTRTARVLRIR